MADNATIGSVGCFDVRGRPPENQEAVVFTEVPGLDGVEAETMGLRGGPFTVIARKIDTHANVESWIDDLRELAGESPVTITLADGAAFDKCYIGGPGGTGVAVTRKQAVTQSDGTAGYYCEVAVSGYRSPT